MAAFLVAALMEGGRSIRGRSSTAEWYRVLQPSDDVPTIDLELTMGDGSIASRVEAIWDGFRFDYRPWVPKQTATANRVTIVRYLPGNEVTAARLDPVLEDPDEDIHSKHTFDATPLLVTWDFDNPRRRISYTVTFAHPRDESKPIASVEHVDATGRG